MPQNAYDSPIVRFGLRFFAVLLMIIAPFTGYLVISQFMEAQASRKWASTPGEISESRVEKKFNGAKTTYEPIIRYRYGANGRQYTGDRVRFHDAGGGKQHEAEARVADYRLGRPVNVFYDPAHVDRSTLETGASWRAYAYMGLPLLMLGLGLLLWRAARTSTAAPETPASAAIPEGS
jgi:hypothetical protein